MDRCQHCSKAECETYLMLNIVRNALALADAEFMRPDKDGLFKAAWEIDHEFRATIRAILE